MGGLAVHPNPHDGLPIRRSSRNRDHVIVLMGKHKWLEHVSVESGVREEDERWEDNDRGERVGWREQDSFP